MLLNTYENHHTETLLVFTISVSMSRRRPIFAYLYDQFFNFIFILQAYLTYFAYFIEYVPSFFDDNMDEECE